MNGHEFAKALRDIADWYNENPDVPVVYDASLEIFGVNGSAQLADIARRLGRADKSLLGNDLYVISRDFSGIRLKFIVDRAQVCTRYVIGRRIVPARAAEPEREEDEVEWVCAPLLPAHQDGDAP